MLLQKLTLGLCFLSASFLFSQDKTTQKSFLPVKVVKLSLGTYKEYGKYLGTVEGFKEANLIAYLGGRVEKINFKTGDAVKKGDLLCSIDGQQMASHLKSAKIAFEIEKTNYERIKRHRKSGSASKLQEKKASLELEKAYSLYLASQKNWSGAFCQSPISGTVVASFLNLHQELKAFSPTVSIASLKKVKVLVDLPESEAFFYKKNRPATVKHPSQKNHTFKGFLSAISQRINPSRRSFKAEVIIESPSEQLKPGHTLTVSLLRQELKNVLLVPEKSLLQRRGKKVAMVANANNEVEVRTVEVQAQNGTIAVVTKGLKSGELCLVEGQHQAAVKTKVQIIERLSL